MKQPRLLTALTISGNCTKQSRTHWWPFRLHWPKRSAQTWRATPSARAVLPPLPRLLVLQQPWPAVLDGRFKHRSDRPGEVLRVEVSGIQRSGMTFQTW